jgi:hypothetical protein
VFFVFKTGLQNSFGLFYWSSWKKTGGLCNYCRDRVGSLVNGGTSVTQIERNTGFLSNYSYKIYNEIFVNTKSLQ